MHGEELVVGRLIEELQVREGQLGPHDQRQGSGQEEESEAREQVEQTDALVVGGGQVVDDSRALGRACGQARAPLQLGGGHGVDLRDANQAANSEGLTARMLKIIWSCNRPQNSAHCPA